MNFIYNGSLESFLSAIEKAVLQENSTISKEPSLFDENIKVHEENIENKIFDEKLYSDIVVLYLSESEGFENLALNYAKCIIKEKKYNNISNEWIRKVNEIKGRFFRELHKYKGFTRFYEIDENLLFAKVAPQNNIIIFLAEYFKKRLRENFVIYDTKRKIAAFRNCSDICLKKVGEIKIQIGQKEKEINTLWRRFFQEIAVKERKNYRLQRSFVPLRYRKHILEFLPE